MTTRRLINESALTYSKLLASISGKTDEEIDAIIDKDDMLKLRTLVEGILSRSQLAELGIRAWPQAEDRIHRVHYPEKPDEN